MRRVYIVRHGNTLAAGEPPRRVGGRSDVALVDSGRAQAQALGAYFRAAGVAFDACVAGPLRRTQETAVLLLGEGTGCAVETAEWLREIDHGPDEDQPETTVLARIGPAALAAWDAAAVPPPGWIVEAERRRTDWHTFLQAQAGLPAGATLVVTSNGAARFAADPPLAKLRTGAWGVLRLQDGTAAVESWDRRPPAG